jgi:hypothetical protein
LESAWEQWRALHGLAGAPSQPIVSYVGYSLKEPWGEPRVVIGIDADEAEYLADFLDRDECGQRGQADMHAEQPAEGGSEYQASPLVGAPVPAVVGGQPASAAVGGQPASVGVGGQQVSAGVGGQPDQARDIAAELAGWTAGELPGQATEQLNGWSPSAPAAAEQPPATA